MYAFAPVQQELIGSISLGGSSEISALQEALKGLAKTGLATDPGAVTGTVTDQTLLALVAALPHIPLEAVLKSRLMGMLSEGLAAVANAGGDALMSLAGTDEVKADAINLIDSQAPAITQAVKSATISRQTGTRVLLPSSSRPSVAAQTQPKTLVYKASPSSGTSSWLSWKVLVPVAAVAGVGLWYFVFRK